MNIKIRECDFKTTMVVELHLDADESKEHNGMLSIIKELVRMGCGDATYIELYAANSNYEYEELLIRS